MERRSNKNRRKYMDPRYQSPANPDFVDRRTGGDRRQVTYQDLPGHPARKWIILIGLVVGVFLIYLFLLANFFLTKNPCRTVRKKTITFAYNEDNTGQHTSAFRASSNRTPRPFFS
jgi:hypothetical protein